MYVYGMGNFCTQANIRINLVNEFACKVGIVHWGLTYV